MDKRPHHRTSILVVDCCFLISNLGIDIPKGSLLSLEKKTFVQKRNVDLVKDEVRYQPEGIKNIDLHSFGGIRKYSFYDIVRSELKLMFKGVPIWWYGVGLILFLLSMFIPLSSTKVFLYFIWLWPIPLLAPLGSKEKMYRTEQLLFSNCPPYMQLFAVWFAGVLVSFLITSGVTVQLIAASDWSWLNAWLVANFFSPTLALAAGIWSGTRKFYEAIFVVWWIMGPVQNAPYLDFTGIQGNDYTNIYLLLTTCLAIIAILRRKRQIFN